MLVFFQAARLAAVDRLPQPKLRGAIFAFHVTLSILAYAAFALSFVLSIIFLGEERLLRRRELGNMVWRLSPLGLLGRLRQATAVGGVFFVSILVGLGFLSCEPLSGPLFFF